VVAQQITLVPSAMIVQRGYLPWLLSVAQMRRDCSGGISGVWASIKILILVVRSTNRPARKLGSSYCFIFSEPKLCRALSFGTCREEGSAEARSVHAMTLDCWVNCIYWCIHWQHRRRMVLAWPGP
jgi:hypothetical protein